MIIVLSQLNFIVGDIEGNRFKIIEQIAAAKKKKASLVIFSELALTGYPAEDLLSLYSFIQSVEHSLNLIIKETEGIGVIVGTIRSHPYQNGKLLYNSAAIIVDRVLIGFQDKTLLPTYDVFDERRFFEPAKEVRLWDIYGKKVAVMICEDMWQHSGLLKHTSYCLDPVETIAALHPDFVVNISASPFSTSKYKVRFQACSKAAKTVKAPLFFCNQVGGNDSLIFDGRSCAFNAQGALLGCAKSFKEDTLKLDLQSEKIIESHLLDPWEELYEALILGLRDYFYKSGFSKACIGLSGGIDSAVVACVAVEALGKENVLGVLMPSRYSSFGSIFDAEELVGILKIESHQISIEAPFKSYLDLLDPYLSTSHRGVTEENIQARIRGMILMALSNSLGCIVLNTGNKSELAMGYSTLYGDMCGGLAVISDLTKRQVYGLANWINRKKIIIPLNSINKPPSAELAFNQKDSDTLPDYEIIDNVVQAYIEDNQDAEQIASYFGYNKELVNKLIQRIYQNEYKRRQSPPCLRVSEKAFSVGRRFPIVQGFFRP